MRILVSGAGGLIGSALVTALEADGQDVSRLVRPGAACGAGDVAWDPAEGHIDAAALVGLDAVVHLAGEPIAGRWTAEKKRRIRDSRVEGTKLLCGALAALPQPPGVLACASAIGYYGSRGEAILAEDAPAGRGFLPDVCAAWEAATAPAREAGVRVANLRLAMVLAAGGGALREMLPPFRLGFGGPVGSGRQFWSWIALTDVVSAIRHVLGAGDLHGPVNLASPNAVTNREFARTLGRALHRPAWLRTPRCALRCLLGEMADELLLASARVEPRALLRSGFPFAQATLEAALGDLLGR